MLRVLNSAPRTAPHAHPLRRGERESGRAQEQEAPQRRLPMRMDNTDRTDWEHTLVDHLSSHARTFHRHDSHVGHAVLFMVTATDAPQRQRTEAWKRASPPHFAPLVCRLCTQELCATAASGQPRSRGSLHREFASAIRRRPGERRGRTPSRGEGGSHACPAIRHQLRAF